MVDAAVEGEQPERLDAETPGDAVLAVGGEHVVLPQHGPPGTDLGRLLTQAGRPDSQLTLSLQRDGLGIDPSGDDHVAIEAADLLVVAGVRVVRPGDAFALRSQQLDEIYVPAGPAGLSHFTASLL